MSAVPLCLLLVLVGCSTAEKQQIRDLAKLALEEKRKVVELCFADPQCRQFVIDRVKAAL